MQFNLHIAIRAHFFNMEILYGRLIARYLQVNLVDVECKLMHGFWIFARLR
jgi:hypothetical protein